MTAASRWHGPRPDGRGRRGLNTGESVLAYVNTIQVESLEEIEPRIGAAGGERVVDAAEIPGVGTVAYFKDSEGNLFGALQPV